MKTEQAQETARSWTEGTLELDEGPVRYREAGQGTPLLFVHGALVNSHLWDQTAELLTDRFRCILPDLPIGSHPEPMKPGADISPTGIARIVGKVRKELGAEDAILVGNDSGGAISQLLVTSDPTRVRGAGAHQLRHVRALPARVLRADVPRGEEPGGPLAASLRR